jgi:hypothetical protein
VTEEERDAVADLLPENMSLWDFEDEIEHFGHATLDWWMDQLGHGPKSPGHRCCKTCGCATTCLAGAFYEATVSTILREVDRLGLLKNPEEGNVSDSLVHRKFRHHDSRIPRFATVCAEFLHPVTEAPMVTYMQSSSLRGEEEPVFYTTHRREFKQWFPRETEN